jgi:hypothetical protein
MMLLRLTVLFVELKAATAVTLSYLIFDYR